MLAESHYAPKELGKILQLPFDEEEHWRETNFFFRNFFFKIHTYWNGWEFRSSMPLCILKLPSKKSFNTPEFSAARLHQKWSISVFSGTYTVTFTVRGKLQRLWNQSVEHRCPSQSSSLRLKNSAEDLSVATCDSRWFGVYSMKINVRITSFLNRQ